MSHPRLLVKVARAPLGLPVGIHALGRYGKEGTLFRLPAQLEEAAPWADRHPDRVPASMRNGRASWTL